MKTKILFALILLCITCKASAQSNDVKIKAFFATSFVNDLHQMNPWKTKSIPMDRKTLVSAVTDNTATCFTMRTKSGKTVEYNSEWLTTVTLFFNLFYAKITGIGVINEGQMLDILQSAHWEKLVSGAQIIVSGRNPYTGKEEVALLPMGEYVFLVYTIKDFKCVLAKDLCFNPCALTGFFDPSFKNAVVEEPEPAPVIAKTKTRKVRNNTETNLTHNTQEQKDLSILNKIERVDIVNAPGFYGYYGSIDLRDGYNRAGCSSNIRIIPDNTVMGLINPGAGYPGYGGFGKNQVGGWTPGTGTSSGGSCGNNGGGNVYYGRRR